MPKKYIISIVIFGAFALAGLAISIYDLVFVTMHYDVVEDYEAYVLMTLSWLFLAASIFTIFLEKRRLEWALVILAGILGIATIAVRFI